MRNAFLFIYSLFVFTGNLANAQDALNQPYFDSLRQVMSRDSNVRKIKFIQTRYLNRNIESQRLFVKYEDDTTNWYWQVGKSFVYYKNGQLSDFDKVDIETKSLTDTSYFYNKAGEPLEIIIYKNISHERKVGVRILFEFKYFFNINKFCVKWPYQFISILYNEGKVYSKHPYTLSKELEYVLDGKVIAYDENGAVCKVEKYDMGKLIEEE